MKVLPAFLLLMLSISACNNNAKNKHIVNKTAVATVPVISIVNDTLIRMHFSAADTGIIATAQHYMNGEHVVCDVNIEKADSIYASVIPFETGGNIRFSQIITPDGKADGPFGQTLRYGTPQPGIYQLIIGENQMAGDKWKGNFKIKVWLK